MLPARDRGAEPFPWIIWADPRTGGTALSAALKAISPHPAVEDEPFQYGPHPKQLAHVYEAWCRDGDPGHVYDALKHRALIKHIPEAFDDGFNAHLARAAEFHGYRHVRILRCDTFAQLVSRGIAEQLNAWAAKDGRRLLAMRTAPLKPLDVGLLIANYRLGNVRWRNVLPEIGTLLTIRTEDFTSRNRERRHDCLRKLLRYLGEPPAALAIVDQALQDSGQESDAAWKLVPNLSELRLALATEGLR